MDTFELNLNGKEIGLTKLEEGNLEIISIPLKITVEKGSFLHIGSAPSPLTEKKGAVFKIDRTPLIPATSFKGILRNQMELLFIKELDRFKEIFKSEVEFIKPCIPAPRLSEAEKELLSKGYRGKIDNNKYTGHCEIQVEETKIKINELGVCPVCYFMGCTGIMGFLRFSNFYPTEGDWLIDQTNIRIDRKTQTAAKGAKVDGEQIKPGTEFKGIIDIISKTPQKFEFGYPRNISNNIIIDKWLENWDEVDSEKRKKLLIEEILFPAVQNIKLLGGQKSRGAGKVKIEIDSQK